MGNRELLSLVFWTIFCGLQSTSVGQSFDYMMRDRGTGQIVHHQVSESGSQAILDVKNGAQVVPGLVPSFTVLGSNLWLVSISGSDAVDEKALAEQGDQFQLRPLLIWEDGSRFGFTGTITIALRPGAKRDEFRGRLAQFGLFSISDAEMDGYELEYPNRIVAKLKDTATNGHLIDANNRLVQDQSDVRWVNLDSLIGIQKLGSSSSAGITR